MASSFGTSSKPNLNVTDTNSLTQMGLSSNLSMDQQVVDAMKKYGPQYAAAVLEANQNSNPTLRNLSDLINSRLIQSKTGIPDSLAEFARNQFRDSMASRGFGDSPYSALTEAKTLGELFNTYQNDAGNQAINFAGIPGVSMTGAELQRGLGLELPTVQQAYENQRTGMEYANDVNLATTNMSNARNREIAARNGALLSAVGGFITPLAPLAGAGVSATGSLLSETSGSGSSGTGSANQFEALGGQLNNLLNPNKTKT